MHNEYNNKLAENYVKIQGNIFQFVNGKQILTVSIN